MFKQLKNKFLWLNMSLLTLMLLLMFAALFIFTIYNSERFIDIALETAIMQPQDLTPKNPLTAASVVVELDESGAMSNISSLFNVDENALYGYVSLIVGNDGVKGTVEMDGGSYAYLMRHFAGENGTDGVTRVAFVSRTSQIDQLTSMLFSFLFVGIAGLTIVFAVSMFFSNKAIKPVEEAFNKQREFTAAASHELKTPLTIINTNLELIYSNPDEPVRDQYKWLHYISTQTKRMSALINDMLTLARVESSSIVFTKINLSDVVRESALAFEVPLYEKNIGFTINVDGDFYVLGDRSSLEQLAYLLIDNAYKYTPQNGSIAIKLSREKGRVRFSVYNTGDGIPPDQINRLFDMFYRLNTARTQNTGGAGLGLSIAKSIAESHNGRISVRSEVTKYTDFIVELPAVQ